MELAFVTHVQVHITLLMAIVFVKQVSLAQELNVSHAQEDVKHALT